jgi:hypothetical protein
MIDGQPVGLVMLRRSLVVKVMLQFSFGRTGFNSKFETGILASTAANKHFHAKSKISSLRVQSKQAQLHAITIIGRERTFREQQVRFVYGMAVKMILKVYVTAIIRKLTLCG